MALYELSIDPNLIREAEKVVSLEGRGFPTLVMRWESRLFDQPWQTTLVLDYLLAYGRNIPSLAFLEGAEKSFEQGSVHKRLVIIYGLPAVNARAFRGRGSHSLTL